MSRAELVITAITTEGLSQAEAARRYGLSEAWVSRLMARYRAEGTDAFQPRSRRPHTHPNAVDPAVVELIVELRTRLAAAGHDAGPDTIAWHLHHHHGHQVSRATISRYLTRAGLITPEPKKRPKTSLHRFQATMPNETWQSDFTHYRLAGGQEVEIITWCEDCTRYALHLSAHRAITTPIVVTTFRATTSRYGIPASTLTDNAHGLHRPPRKASAAEAGATASSSSCATGMWSRKTPDPAIPPPAGRSNASNRPSRTGCAANPTSPRPCSTCRAS